MPLDATGFDIDVSTAVDPLMKLGITPLDTALVEQHKRAFVQAWMRSGDAANRVLSECRWKTIHHSRWQDNYAMFRRLWSGHRPKHASTVSDFLAAPFKFGGNTRDKGAAPRRLIRLARFIEGNLPGAMFSVEYFDIDPILHVSYSHQGQWVTVPLGIWQHECLVAIAAHKPLGGISMFLNRWFGR